MKVFWTLISLIFFVGGFALFGYAFQAGEIFAGGPDLPYELLMFSGGLLAVAIAGMIPMHLLEKFD